MAAMLAFDELGNGWPGYHKLELMKRIQHCGVRRGWQQRAIPSITAQHPCSPKIHHIKSLGGEKQ